MAKKSSLERVIQGVIGIALIILGATTTMSGAGAPIGVPMALLGVYLTADAFNIKFKL